MWSELLELQVPLLEKVLRAALLYVVILALVRIGGKRGLAETNAMDFVVVFLLAEGMGGGLEGDDTSITGAAVTAVTITVLNGLTNRLSDAFPAVRRVIQGSATTIIDGGEVDERAMKKLGLQKTELDHAVRSQNGDSLDEIEHGQLTPSGKLVLSLKPEEQSANKGDIEDLQGRLERIESMLADAVRRR